MACSKVFYVIKEKICLISWISLLIYLFYNSFCYYLEGPQFHYLRRILGLGLCISRAAASVLNLSCALILLPLCKKFNSLIYQLVSLSCPRLFFLWLEKAKSMHVAVAVTLVVFSVVHSISHLVNFYNFSKNYEEDYFEINLAIHKNQNPIKLLLSHPGLTGLALLLIILVMSLTSLRNVRKTYYNIFWYCHQLFLPFMVLLIIHPLSGVLKEEVVIYTNAGKMTNFSQIIFWTAEKESPKFISIKSETWKWMIFPLSCFVIDSIWRMISRYLSPVRIVKVLYLPGRVISLTLSCQEKLQCMTGQYVLIQCPQISVLEWHPFSIVQIPTDAEKELQIWVKVLGDWTKEFELLLLQQSKNVCVIIDGPFSSPLQEVAYSRIGICVAAGIGITPFVSLLQTMAKSPRCRYPGRIHLIWIVRNEIELNWIAELATNAMKELKNANRLDRLHLEFYVTNTNDARPERNNHIVFVNEIGEITQKIIKPKDKLLGFKVKHQETINLLTSNSNRGYINVYTHKVCKKQLGEKSFDLRISTEYPLLGCRIRLGRPNWDGLFEYWAHIYRRDHLRLFVCGPKSLTKQLRLKSEKMNMDRVLYIKFIHEGF